MEKLNRYDLSEFHINNSFYEELNFLITIKSFDLQSIRNRYIKSVKTTSNNTVGSVEKRDSHIGGLALLKLRNGKIVSEKLLLETKEPRGIDVDDERWAYSSENLIFVIEGNKVFKIENDWFSYIHTVKFSPFNKDHIMISSSGLDIIFEVNYKTNTIVKEWCAWENGFNISYYKEDDTDLLLTRQKNVSEKYLKQGLNHLYISNPQTDFLPTAKRAAFINSIAYHPNNENKCLATFFHEGTVREINFNTGKSKVLHNAMNSPHGGMYVNDKLIVTNTRGGEVIVKGNNVSDIFEFKNLEAKSSELKDKEWIQNSILVNNNVVSIDSNRNCFVLIDLSSKKISMVPFNKNWAVQDIISISNKGLIDSLYNIDISKIQ